MFIELFYYIWDCGLNIKGNRVNLYVNIKNGVFTSKILKKETTLMGRGYSLKRTVADSTLKRWKLRLNTAVTWISLPENLASCFGTIKSSLPSNAWASFCKKKYILSVPYHVHTSSLSNFFYHLRPKEKDLSSSTNILTVSACVYSDLFQEMEWLPPIFHWLCKIKPASDIEKFAFSGNWIDGWSSIHYQQRMISIIDKKRCIQLIISSSQDNDTGKRSKIKTTTQIG